MKSLLIIALFVSSAAFADSLVIAQSRQSAGFIHDPRCGVRLVTVHADGQVKLKDCYHPTVVTFAKLNTTLVKNIQQLAKNLVEAQLERQDPNATPCMDAPATTFSALNGEGKMVDVGGQWGCLPMEYPGYSSQAQSLSTILDGLNVLSFQL